MAVILLVSVSLLKAVFKPSVCELCRDDYRLMIDVQTAARSFHLEESTKWLFRGSFLFHFYWVGVIKVTEVQSSSESDTYCRNRCCSRMRCDGDARFMIACIYHYLWNLWPKAESLMFLSIACLKWFGQSVQKYIFDKPRIICNLKYIKKIVIFELAFIYFEFF